jgi:hypothetical protein
LIAICRDLNLNGKYFWVKDAGAVLSPPMTDILIEIEEMREKLADKSLKDLVT